MQQMVVTESTWSTPNAAQVIGLAARQVVVIIGGRELPLLGELLITACGRPT